MESELRTFTIVIAAHGPLAAGFLAAAEMICGPQDGLVALGLEPDESPDGFGARLRDAINVSDGPALVLADLPGGTPHTVASLVARDRPGTWVIAGANLGMRGGGGDERRSPRRCGRRSLGFDRAGRYRGLERAPGA